MHLQVGVCLWRITKACATALQRKSVCHSVAAQRRVPQRCSAKACATAVQRKGLCLWRITKACATALQRKSVCHGGATQRLVPVADHKGVCHSVAAQKRVPQRCNAKACACGASQRRVPQRQQSKQPAKSSDTRPEGIAERETCWLGTGARSHTGHHARAAPLHPCTPAFLTGSHTEATTPEPHPCTPAPMHPSTHAPLHPCMSAYSCTHPLMHPCSHAPIHSCTPAPLHECIIMHPWVLNGLTNRGHHARAPPSKEPLHMSALALHHPMHRLWSDHVC